MIRLIIRIDDAGMAANVGGAVLTEYRTFDLDAPEIEAALSAAAGKSYTHAQIVGAEVTNADLRCAEVRLEAAEGASHD